MGYTPLFKDVTDAVVHLIMPAITLGTAMAASLTRFTRSEMLEELRKDYVPHRQGQGTQRAGGSAQACFEKLAYPLPSPSSACRLQACWTAR